ncbi:hypothetical protein, partial [Escherichia coli]|uniref:hypothetical protein n=1 Tax=Escherichia coli TaxID=562 RepID=UPI00195399BB
MHTTDIDCRFHARAARGLARAKRFALAMLVVFVVGIGLAGIAVAANNSVQGGAAKKEAGGFETDAPYAILIEAESG